MAKAKANGPATLGSTSGGNAVATPTTAVALPNVAGASPVASATFDFEYRECALQRVNRLNFNSAESFRRGLMYRCRRHSCPACSAYEVRPRVAAALLTAGNWSFRRCGLTLLYPLVDYDDIAPADLAAAAYDRALLAAALGSHPGVLAFLIKFEVAPALRPAPGAHAAARLHNHLDIMLRPECSLNEIVGLCASPGVTVGKVSPDADLGWLDYLGKPVLWPLRGKDGKVGCDPYTHARIVTALDAWQKEAAGDAGVVDFGGWYDRRKATWPEKAARLLKAISDPSRWQGVAGYMRRAGAIATAGRTEYVRKWEWVADHYAGKLPAVCISAGRPKPSKPKGQPALA